MPPTTKEPKQLRRIKNRERWDTHPLNANAAHAEMKQLLKRIPVPEVTDVGSLSQLRAIVADTEAPLYRRVEAAEIVLSYELAPGSAINMPQEQIAAASYRFMQAVADHAETPDNIRFKCLRSLASIENARARVGDTEALADRRVHLLELVNAARRRHLISSGCWPASHRWQLDPSDDIDIPRLSQSLDSIGTSLDRASASARASDRRSLLLSIVARNRPDNWRQS
jgi:hypothetical protein